MENQNKTYFAKAVSGEKSFSYRDIFSGVLEKHSKSDMDRAFASGLQGHIPDGSHLLDGWQKPWIFSRFFLYGLLAWILCSVICAIFGQNSAIVYGAICLVPASVIPLSALLFFWEMNIPRNIPIYDVLKWLVLGGIICSPIGDILQATILKDDTKSVFMGWIYVGIVEELIKLIVIAYILRKAERCWGLNGLLIGAAVGAGFALFETNGYAVNVLLNNSGNLNAALSNLTARGITGLCGHIAYGSMYGGALALAKGRRKLDVKHFTDPTFLIAFFAAILCHGCFDYVADYQSMAFLKMLQENGWTTLYKFFMNDGWNGLLPVVVVAILFTAIEYSIVLVVLRKSVQQVVAYSSAPPADHQIQVIGSQGGSTPAAQPSGSVLVLECVSGELNGTSYTIEKGMLFKIGRGSTNNIQYSDTAKGISREHCSVTFDGVNAIVTDLNSTHGTFFPNGAKFQPEMHNPMKNGDTFYLATPKNTFRINIR